LLKDGGIRLWIIDWAMMKTRPVDTLKQLSLKHCVWFKQGLDLYTITPAIKYAQIRSS
jgi:hypothetical protein